MLDKKLEALQLKRKDVYFEWKKLDDYIASVQRETHLKTSKLQKMIPDAFKKRYQFKQELNRLNIHIEIREKILGVTRGNY